MIGKSARNATGQFLGSAATREGIQAKAPKCFARGFSIIERPHGGLKTRFSPKLVIFHLRALCAHREHENRVVQKTFIFTEEVRTFLRFFQLIVGQVYRA